MGMRIVLLAFLLTAICRSVAYGQQPDSVSQHRAEIEESPEYVISTRANLRASPSLDSTVVRTLERGTTVYVQKSKGWWIQVRVRIEEPSVDGHETAADLEEAYETGWMHHTVLSPDKPVLMESTSTDEQIAGIRRQLTRLLAIRWNLAVSSDSASAREQAECTNRIRPYRAELAMLQRRLDQLNDTRAASLQIAANRLRTCLTCNPLLVRQSCAWARKALKKSKEED